MQRNIVAFCLILLIMYACGNFTLANAEASANFGDCRTPDRKEGSCVYLHECHALNDILKKGNVTDAERAFLQASQCGYHNSKYLVCCIKMTIHDRFSPDLSSLPELPNCPVEFTTRVVGGFDTEFDEFPWLARIEYMKPGNTTGFDCGGNLINNRYVLTAAHCVKGLSRGWTPFSVRLGEWDTRTNPDCIYNDNGVKDCADYHVDVLIEKIISHPQFTPSSRNRYHDIALIRLSKTVDSSDFIKPICLPIESSLRDASLERLQVYVAGWGVTKTENSSVIKQTASLLVWNAYDCQIKYASRRIALQSAGQMCAGGKEGIDTCSGDSGGPLFYKHIDGRPFYILVGIVSFGQKQCGQPGWPGVYTRVGQYLDWIQANVTP